MEIDRENPLDATNSFLRSGITSLSRSDLARHNLVAEAFLLFCDAGESLFGRYQIALEVVHGEHSVTGYSGVSGLGNVFAVGHSQATKN